MRQLIRSIRAVFFHPLNKNRIGETLIRILWWKMNQLFFHLPAIVDITPNRKCICYPDSSYGGLFIYMGIPEYEGVNYILKNLNADDIFIDVGACIGDYSLFASSVITHGHIYAFEPYYKSVALFEENIRLNGIKNISIFKGVASDKNGYERLNVEKEVEINHITHNKNDSNTVKVPSITLDTYIENNHITEVSILKIDVEGAEMKVLHGAEKNIKRKTIKKILIELNNNNQFFGTSNKDIAQWLEDKGYRLYILNENKAMKIKKVDISNDQILNILAILKS